jgi:hypothetical protein
VLVALLGANVAAVADSANPAERSTIVARMGHEMSESAARHSIAFAPFSPPRHVLVVALLPPFRGADVKANRGIAFEYADDTATHRYALAQWPAHGGSIERFAPLRNGDAACTDARTFRRTEGPDGIVWSTPRGLVMTLQADGTNDARTLEAEWRKLILRGACR